jgi:hypothetical protein
MTVMLIPGIYSEYGTLRGQYKSRESGNIRYAIAANPMLHQFSFDPRTSQVATASKKLGLHVGDDGIVGRTMSVEFQGNVVREEIIGWL